MAPTTTEQALAAAATTTAATKPPPPPHFILVPLPAHGHVIPMVDLARLLASCGARASLLTTPLNVARIRGTADAGQAARFRAPLDLELVELSFSPVSFGLPPDCQNADKVTDNAQFHSFLLAVRELAGPFEAYVRALEHRPSCIVYDWCNSWTAPVASSLGIPRLFFQGPSCLYSLCDLMAYEHRLREKVAAAGDEETTHVVPGVPVPVKVTKDTVPGWFYAHGCEWLLDEAMAAMRTADGAVVNTFFELEAKFVACYEAALGMPVWALGPFCLVNNRDDAEAEDKPRGSVSESAITAWLDAQAPGSVVYASFGSVARKLPRQLFEVGHGLEDSGAPFLWVVKESEEQASPGVRPWLDALEARTAGRGLVVRGWAPQLAILSHPAVGGFVTHCGWNSLLESIAHGVPVVTWPHFADQFVNEQLAVDVLGVGVPVGATTPVMILGDDAATPVARGDIARAVSALMDGGEEAEGRRRKAKMYGEKARGAMEEEGDSYENLTRLIESFGHGGGRRRTMEQHATG